MDDGRKGDVGADGTVAPVQDIAVSQLVFQAAPFAYCRATQRCRRLPDLQGYERLESQVGTWLRRRTAGLLPIRGTTWLVQTGHRGRHHLAQALCRGRISRRTGREAGAAAAQECKGKQCRRSARQSRLVPPSGLRITQRGDLASAV